MKKNHQLTEKEKEKKKRKKKDQISKKLEALPFIAIGDSAFYKTYDILHASLSHHTKNIQQYKCLQSQEYTA